MALSTVFNDPFFNTALSSAWPDQFSTLFETEPLRVFYRDSQATSRTAVDVKETPKEYQFIADMPGHGRDNVKVQIEDGNVLAIRGERVKEERQDTDIYHRVERGSGQFFRRFRLPEDADTDQVHAASQHGVLTVTIPKKQPKEPEQRPTKEIQVQ